MEKLVILPLFAFIAIFALTIEAQQAQRFIFFTTPNCTGNSLRDLTSSNSFQYSRLNNTNTTTGSGSVQANGLWRIKNCPVQNASCITNSNNLYYSESLNVSCTRINETWANASWIHATIYGDQNQNAKSINLFPETYLNGIETKYSGSTPNISLSFKSFFFTGNNNWTLYASDNYKGNSSCFTPTQVVKGRGYGIKYEYVYNGFPIKSIKEGCGGSGVGLMQPLMGVVFTALVALIRM